MGTKTDEAQGDGGADRSHLAIWDALKSPERAHTNEFTRPGGFRGTATDPVSTYLRMTALFGPCGEGWKIGVPAFSVDGDLVFCTVTVQYRYRDRDGVLGWSEPVPGVGGDMMRKKRRDGSVEPDDESWKKAYTDSVTNALKHIGANAEVYLGRHDGSKYLAREHATEDEPPTRERTTKPATNGNGAKGAANSAAPPDSYVLRDENGDKVGTFESILIWASEAGKIALDLKTAAEIEAFKAANRAEWKRMTAAATPDERIALERLSGVLAKAVKTMQRVGAPA